MKKTIAKKQLSPFTLDVITLIKKIPLGKVASYSQIANLAGKPGGARSVVWVLHSCSQTYSLPWHRVVNAKGHTFQQKQKHLLKKEGITFKDAEHVDLKAHLWARKAGIKKTSIKLTKNHPRMFA
jgi:methylated-DNA-protein-cysteine methyltransferase related protein